MDLDSDCVLTAKVTLAQLEAMGCERFDIGVKRSEGTMHLREGGAQSRF